MTTTHDAPDAAIARAATPDRIFEIAQGFMASKHLFAANSLGLFEVLGEGPADIDALAARTGLTRRAARISADAMVALGLLEREGDRYANGPAAATYLSGSTPADLRPLLTFWDRLSYPVWQDLAASLGRGRPAREIFEIDDELVPVMSAGIAAATAGAARALPAAAQLPAGARLLDVGGGTGSWSIALAAADEALTATVLELPEVAGVAEQHVSGSPCADRVAVRACDVLADELPRGFTAFLVANLVHYFTPATNQSLLERIRSVADPGARLLVADFWTDATHTRPLPAALMAGEFAIHVNDGDVYSVEEAADWLGATGWRFVGHAPLAGPMSVVIAESV